VAIGPQSELTASGLAPDRVFDLGQAVLIPGLINAHTHLEFSDLEQPLGQSGMPFTDWIEAIIECRMNAGQSSRSKHEVIGQAMRRSFQNGVWAVGDIATLPATAGDYSIDNAQHPKDRNPPTPADFHRTVFLEQLGRDITRLAELAAAADKFQRTFRGGTDPQLTPALSPHAPYSTHPRLVQQVCDAASKHDGSVAMHLAETKEERQLVEAGEGPFVDLLKKLGVWNPDSFHPPTTILDTLRQLATASRSLIIHGNYLTDAELDFVAAHAERMSIVFCPRTHAYFRHEAYRLDQMIERGINVAVGTDSLASNPDLNVIDELRLIQSSFTGLSPDAVLRMGTINGATALGIADDYGSLTPGKRAAVSMIDCPLNRTPQPFDWLTQATATCRPITQPPFTK
jgi:cytosine/adenosine deaminase-related metal-dependent hydrolase